MEADSLQQLNSLAFDPPQYPEKPLSEKQEPLVLYISRVPGTRDVILSPAKPQLKNVTAEDISICLYYIHWKGAILDIPAPRPIHADDVGNSSDDGSSSMVIPRKPLPTIANPTINAPNYTAEHPTTLASDQPPRGFLEVEQPEQVARRSRAATTNSHDNHRLQGQNQPTRTDSFGLLDYSVDTPMKPPASIQIQTPPARKPVGPRAMVSPPGVSLERKAAFGLVEPADSSNGGSRRGSGGRGIPTSRSPSPRKRGLFIAPNAEPFTLELIRRNPSNGQQWTIGQIASHQLDNSQSSEDNQLGFLQSPSAEEHDISPPIDIQLQNAGYSKFRPPAGKGSSEEFTTPEIEYCSFRRQVLMAYSKSWASNMKEKLHRLEEHVTQKGHVRRESDASGEADKEITPLGYPGPGMKRRGYVFTSPWDGKCVFRTGNTGKSVKCFHTQHDGQSGVYNPLGAEYGSTVSKSSAVEVSELRFNLPGSEIYSTGNNGEQDVETRLRGHFAKLLNGGKDDDHNGNVSPFELNIGGEKAGGGSRGTRAKLGKLIVYDDGLKMLDLVVAANIGVWWGAYERSF